MGLWGCFGLLLLAGEEKEGSGGREERDRDRQTETDRQTNEG